MYRIYFPVTFLYLNFSHYLCFLSLIIPPSPSCFQIFSFSLPLFCFIVPSQFSANFSNFSIFLLSELFFSNFLYSTLHIHALNTLSLFPPFRCFPLAVSPLSSYFLLFFTFPITVFPFQASLSPPFSNFHLIPSLVSPRHVLSCQLYLLTDFSLHPILSILFQLLTIYFIFCFSSFFSYLFRFPSPIAFSFSLPLLYLPLINTTVLLFSLSIFFSSHLFLRFLLGSFPSRQVFLPFNFFFHSVFC